MPLACPSYHFSGEVLKDYPELQKKAENPTYTPPEGTTEFVRPARSRSNPEKWVLFDTRSSTYIGTQGTYEQAKESADKENQRMADAKTQRETEESKFKKLEWGNDKPGYLRRITSSAGVGRFLRASQEVAWIDQAYDNKQAVYLSAGKLVRIGKGDKPAVHEVPVSDISGWKDNKAAREAQKKFTVNTSTAEEPAKTVAVKGGMVAAKAKEQIAALEVEYEALDKQRTAINMR